MMSSTSMSSITNIPSIESDALSTSPINIVVTQQPDIKLIDTKQPSIKQPSKKQLDTKQPSLKQPNVKQPSKKQSDTKQQDIVIETQIDKYVDALKNYKSVQLSVLESQFRRIHDHSSSSSRHRSRSPVDVKKKNSMSSKRRKSRSSSRRRRSRSSSRRRSRSFRRRSRSSRRRSRSFSRSRSPEDTKSRQQTRFDYMSLNRVPGHKYLNFNRLYHEYNFVHYFENLPLHLIKIPTQDEYEFIVSYTVQSDKLFSLVNNQDSILVLMEVKKEDLTKFGLNERSSTNTFLLFHNKDTGFAKPYVYIVVMANISNKKWTILKNYNYSVFNGYCFDELIKSNTHLTHNICELKKMLKQLFPAEKLRKILLSSYSEKCAAYKQKNGIH